PRPTRGLRAPTWTPAPSWRWGLRLWGPHPARALSESDLAARLLAMRAPARPSPAGTLDLLTWRPAPRPAWSGFRLFCWNLLADAHLRPSWYPACAPADLAPDRRRERLLARLSQVQAEVLALQEVEPSLLPALRAAFPDHHLSFAPHGGEGLAVLVRGGAERVEALALPGGRKQALLAELPGGLRLAVVHLSWTGDPPAAPRRGLDQLQAVLDRAPDLLCGDLNSLPGWPERARAQAAGLVDHSPPGPTCNVGGRLQALDVVMARPGVRVRAAPLPPITSWTPMPSAAHPSDHLPILAEVQVGSGRRPDR
ncbi:endonuclease/exonuclease/phosphatase family protein, partial [Myxococcota bacterium]|nr:endonuclease/exonuclease/phosphatase family protein [Myxococcota bacterium]